MCSLQRSLLLPSCLSVCLLRIKLEVERYHSQNSDFHLGDLSICDFFMGFWVIFTSKFHNLTAHRAFAFFISSSRVLSLSYFPFESNSARVRDYSSRFKSMKVWRCILHGIKVRDQIGHQTPGNVSMENFVGGLRDPVAPLKKFNFHEQRTDLISKQLSSNSVIDEPTEMGISSSVEIHP
ncbi:hypothetical protein NC653_005130 [Populus alba x Populus x berolinensis]|uniref:Uncharacterized protein n=1 Tax=Populus alba x Populus x berolinensis TaxID=444605 RepID=A0AAD6RB72_9ROSI|nr:hypothetical protein NC653_005130 [Populus alba x Populus x berolinensis]